MATPEQKKNDRLTLSLVVAAWVAAISVIAVGSGFSLSDAADHLHAGNSAAHVAGKHTLSSKTE